MKDSISKHYEEYRIEAVKQSIESIISKKKPSLLPELHVKIKNHESEGQNVKLPKNHKTQR